MLLRQAMYEVEKLLPVPPDAPEHVRAAQFNKSLVASFASASENESSVVTGHTQGSMGTYEFEFHLNSREYTSLERTLLDDGYTRTTPRTSFLSYEGFVYTHPSLPAKCIDGKPLAIRDSPRAEDDDPI